MDENESFVLLELDRAGDRESGKILADVCKIIYATQYHSRF
jgi:hypothetical protein